MSKDKVITEPFKTKKEVISFFREHYSTPTSRYDVYIDDGKVRECWESIAELIPPDEFENYIDLGLFGQDMNQGGDPAFSDNYRLAYAYNEALKRLDNKKKDGHE